MSTSYWINITAGQTVHLREYAETNTSNVITELPRGQEVTFRNTMSDWKEVDVFDGVDTIQGYVMSRYLSTLPITIAAADQCIPRYSAPVWKRSSHSGKYYLPVKRIQTDLYNLGYTKVGTADGYYGSNTEAAVKAFQSDHSLTVDGYFGNKSKAKLYELITDKR